MTPTRYRAASLPRDHADLSRRLGSGLCAEIGSTDDARTVISLRPGRAGTPEETAAESLILSGPFGRIGLTDGVRLLRALTGIDLDADAGRDGNVENMSWLHAAVLGRLAATPFAAADSITHGALPPDSSHCVLHLKLREEQHAVSCIARADAATWLAFLKEGRWLREQAPIDPYLDLPIVSRIRMASHSFPAATLGTIMPGDVILPDMPCFSCDGIGLIRINGMPAQVQYLATNSLEILTLETNLNEHGFTPPDDSDATTGLDNDWPHSEEENSEPTTQGAPAPAADDVAAIDLDSVPVRLDFELGTLSIRLGELRHLAAGVVLPIENGSPASVMISSSGRMLGRGEIVDVDGRLGIRILNWI